MRTMAIPAVAAAVMLAGCGQPPGAGSGNTVAVANGSADRGTPAGTADSATGTVPIGGTGPLPVDAPVSGNTDSASPETAVAVVNRYYTAIDDGDYRAAYALWAGDGQASDQSFDEFRNGFAQTDDSEVTVGTPKRPEGAAGSVYIEVPVVVEAELKDGTQQHFTGSYTLKRVDDVPGSSAEQQRWHLYSADLTTED